MLRPIDTRPFIDRLGALPAADMTRAPTLEWLRIDRLGIDPVYQREIVRRGADNVIAIARSFDWSKFGTVVVAPRDGRYAIIDGQHRVTAAALRGIVKVPCQIVSIDEAAQAAAFNGNVTKPTAHQIHYAKLASGDPASRELAEACRAAGVTIARYPIAANFIKPGETNSISDLRRSLQKYGRDIFVLACRCITKTRQGNPGYLRAAVVEALCVTLDAEPEWASNDKQLLRAMSRFRFAESFSAAQIAAVRNRTRIVDEFIGLLTDHLEKNWAKVA